MLHKLLTECYNAASSWRLRGYCERSALGGLSFYANVASPRDNRDLFNTEELSGRVRFRDGA